MVREAQDLAKQRAALEAALAAERVDAQGHGYTPTPLATPKPVKVGPANLSPLNGSHMFQFPTNAFAPKHPLKASTVHRCLNVNHHQRLLVNCHQQLLECQLSTSASKPSCKVPALPQSFWKHIM